MTRHPLQRDYAQARGLAAHDSERIASVGAKAYTRIADIWQLNNAVASELIAVSPRTWARMKTGVWAGQLKRDQLMRISAITGLYKALGLYFSDPVAKTWVSLPNGGPLFGGRQPLQAMSEGGLPAIMEIRNYVDALRGGL